MTNKQNINILVFHLYTIKDEMVKNENSEMGKFLSQKRLTLSSGLSQMRAFAKANDLSHRKHTEVQKKFALGLFERFLLHPQMISPFPTSRQ
jgi:hypothetical protein